MSRRCLGGPLSHSIFSHLRDPPFCCSAAAEPNCASIVVCVWCVICPMLVFILIFLYRRGTGVATNRKIKRYLLHFAGSTFIFTAKRLRGSGKEPMNKGDIREDKIAYRISSWRYAVASNWAHMQIARTFQDRLLEEE